MIAFTRLAVLVSCLVVVDVIIVNIQLHTYKSICIESIGNVIDCF